MKIGTSGFLHYFLNPCENRLQVNISYIGIGLITKIYLKISVFELKSLFLPRFCKNDKKFPVSNFWLSTGTDFWFFALYRSPISKWTASIENVYWQQFHFLKVTWKWLFLLKSGISPIFFNPFLFKAILQVKQMSEDCKNVCIPFITCQGKI